MKTELVQKVTGTRQRTKRDCFDMSKMGCIGGHCDEMVTDVLESLNQALESRRAVQQIGTGIPGLWLSLFPLLWLPWVQKLAV